MNSVDTLAVSALAPGDLLGFFADAPRLIECEAGLLWVTESGCESDWFLKAGDRHVTGCGRHVVVEAIVSGRCRITRTR